VTTIAQTSTFNIEATLNAWLFSEIAAFSGQLPANVTLPSVFLVWTPITTAVTPCYSVVHIPVSVNASYQGNVTDGTLKGAAAAGLMDVSAWVNHDTWNYGAQMRTMQDMVQTALVRNNGGIVVKDYAASVTAPANTSFLIRLRDCAADVPRADTDNPAIWRGRMLLAYEWVYRAS